MASTRKNARRALQSWFGGMAVGAIARLPLPVARGVGAFLGRCGNVCARKTMRATRDHLDGSFGGSLSVRELRVLSRAVLPTIGAQICESLVFSRWGMPTTLERVRIEGFEEFRAAIARARTSGAGVVAIGSHFGHWETMAALLAHACSEDVICVARRYEVEGYQRVIDGIRARLGVPVIAQEDSLLPVIRTLKRAGVLGLLPDQDFKNLHDGLFVEFLGRPAYTTTAPAELALRTGASLLVATTHRVGDRLVVRTTGPIPIERFRSAEDPVRAITAWWSQELTDRIRSAPEQWVWMHRRWRTTPDRLAYRALRRKEREVKRRGEAPSPQ